MTNVSRQFEALKLMLDLETVVANKSDAISISILIALQDQATPLHEVILFIRDLADERIGTLYALFGPEIVDRVLAWR